MAVKQGSCHGKGNGRKSKRRVEIASYGIELYLISDFSGLMYCCFYKRNKRIEKIAIFNIENGV